MVRTLTLSTITIMLLITALVTVNGLLLTLILPFFLALSIGVYYAVDQLQVKATRTLSTERLLAGSTLRVTITVTNKGGYISELQIEDVISPRLNVTEGYTSLITSMESGETVTLSYELNGPRGQYHFPSLYVVASDPLGLFWRRKMLAVEGVTESLIVPKVEKVNAITIRPRHTRAFAGYIPARIAGSGINFFGVREYRAGDSLRHVNWKATARHNNTIFTNEFEQERVTDIGIIVDARERAIVRAEDSGLLEYGIEAASTFSDSLLAAGNRVGLLVYGSYLDWTVPGYGKLQQQKILQSLSATKLGSSQVFETLDHLPTRLFPVKSQIILISPLLQDDIRAVHSMRARGYAVLIVSPDPVTYEYSLLEDSETTRLAARLARIERELLLRQLRQLGAQVVNWDTRQSLADLVKAKLQRPLRDVEIFV
ncbi:MAG: DUF58 domain-containing protein [Candidatus Promineifilaceae bacterium]